jgi:hypothetical protein
MPTNGKWGAEVIAGAVGEPARALWPTGWQVTKAYIRNVAQLQG